ncbi:hypothetical protein [Saccharopolyspora hattusasensis]|uniref:hypothetical protein n=1 Tax=Saccharopolyspora hattusasensis TaxID=1128679 RepID=UPI003D95A37E
MTAAHDTLTLTVVAAEGFDGHALNRLTRELAAEIRAIDLVAEPEREEIDSTESRSNAAVVIGTLAVSGVLSKPLLSALVSLAQSWLRRNEQDKIVVEIDGDKFELSGSPAADPAELLDSFYRNRRDNA